MQFNALSLVLSVIIVATYTVAQAAVSTATLTATASSALSSASILAALPPCGPPCVNLALAASGCSLTNLTCICTDATFNRIVGPCEIATCSTTKLNDRLIPYFEQLCSFFPNGINQATCSTSNISIPALWNETGYAGENLTGVRNVTGGGNATNGNMIISSTPTPSVFLGQGGNMRAGGYILGWGLTAAVMLMMHAWS